MSSQGRKLHKCTVCGKVFISEYYLNMHTKRHRSYVLSVITVKKSDQFETLTKGDLNTPTEKTKHTKFKAARPKRFPLKSGLCSVCGLTYLSLQAHMNQSRCGSCHTCGKIFRYFPDLESHIAEAHGSKAHRCTLCYEEFDTLLQRLEHLKTHCRCSQCGEVFLTDAGLTSHKQGPCSQVMEVAVENECPVCRKQLPDKPSFLEHMETHNNITRPTCSVCGSNFAKMSTLKRHFTITHILKKPRRLRCIVCRRLYTRLIDLNKHMRTHEQHRSTPNDHNKLSELNAQQQMHKETTPQPQLFSWQQVALRKEMPYTCAYCGKWFRISRNLSKHMRVHDCKDSKVEKRDHCTCNICDRVFVRAADLAKHMNRCHQGVFSHNMLQTTKNHTKTKTLENQSRQLSTKRTSGNQSVNPQFTRSPGNQLVHLHTTRSPEDQLGCTEETKKPTTTGLVTNIKFEDSVTTHPITCENIKTETTDTDFAVPVIVIQPIVSEIDKQPHFLVDNVSQYSV